MFSRKKKSHFENVGSDAVSFSINGKVYHADNNTVTAETTLNQFIRDHAFLKGTKYMCQGGMCGACIVTMQTTHPVTKQDNYYAVNSCLVPVLTCHGASITTVEGLGDKNRGYHNIQSALNNFSGSQCGYCSPGMVMNMYSLTKSCSTKLTMEEIENSFGGNTCRCTGYRPILDAFKSLANDASVDLKQKLIDIEDLSSCSIEDCQKCLDQSDDSDICFVETSLAPKSLKLNFNHNGSAWYRVSSVFEIMQVFDLINDLSYSLVAGNTSTGVYPIVDPPAVFIDINDVAELRTSHIFPDRIEIGGNLTLNEFKNLLKTAAQLNPLMFGHGIGMADHIDLVANVPVRNIGTVAGNLSMKHQHREFYSDIFLILETAGAVLTIRHVSGAVNVVSLTQYLETDMNHKVIVGVTLPAISSRHYVMRTFKIMPRKQTVEGYVNAGFLFRIINQKYFVEEQPKIVFGGINPEFVHAGRTEGFLLGKCLNEVATVQGAISSLQQEIVPDKDPLKPSPDYRVKLACSLFYKFILGVCGSSISPKFKTGATELVRPLSSGKQDFPNRKKDWPVGKPVPKLEGTIQCSGEAEYAYDVPPFPGELFGALVVTEVATADLIGVDPSQALALPGVVAFYSAKDIPGKNSFTFFTPLTVEDEEIFCSKKILYAGQPVGIVIATDQKTADKAATKVKMRYSTTKKPLLTIKEVLKSGDVTRVIPQFAFSPKSIGKDIKYEFEGEIELGPQYHYTMELQSCVCVPTDIGMKVYSATQWLQCVQTAISQSLNIPQNNIDVETKRVGGAYGCKITRSALVAAACALAAQKLNTPIRAMINMETSMKAIGKRCSVLGKYQVAVNDEGKIQFANINVYDDYGCSLNETVMPFIKDSIKGTYDASTWKFNFFAVKTDNASATWTRAPGTLEGIAITEDIMENIAHVVKKDALSVKMANLSEEDKATMDEMTATLKKSSNYDERQSSVAKFNKENRWKKKGLGIVLMKFPIEFFPGYYAMVSIFAGDGTVMVTTGGVEIGQGLNTKAAQVCAHTLGIDLSKISVRPCQIITAPNNFPTGGSITSDASVYKCCMILKDRLKLIVDKLPDAAWIAVLQAAVLAGVDLNASHMYTITDEVPKPYAIYGVTALEIELDVLTGQYQILRADILEDAGESLSPLVDIGQVEGAFVMGLGYFGSEELKFDPKTGRNLTIRAWTYWPPGAKDIPADFRITLRKNAPNPKGVLRSKATGEPPLCMSSVLLVALRQAVRSARLDAGLDDKWIKCWQPCTFEKTHHTIGTDLKEFKL